MNILKSLIFLSFVLFSSCSAKLRISEFVTTTANSSFEEQSTIKSNKSNLQADFEVIMDKPLQKIEGFGGCFNELGWQALSLLKTSEREDIIKNLFDSIIRYKI